MYKIGNLKPLKFSDLNSGKKQVFVLYHGI